MRRARREPTIALINIVFLMLIFFMVAGTLAQPMDSDLRLVETRTLEGSAPPNALVIHGDGRLSFRGDDQADIAGFLEGLSEEDRAEVRIVPDRDLPAETLVAMGQELRAGGAGRVLIVTERALQ